MADHFVIVLL